MARLKRAELEIGILAIRRAKQLMEFAKLEKDTSLDKHRRARAIIHFAHVVVAVIIWILLTAVIERGSILKKVRARFLQSAIRIEEFRACRCRLGMIFKNP